MCDKESRDLMRGHVKKSPKKNRKNNGSEFADDHVSMDNEDSENKSIIAQNSAYTWKKSESQVQFKCDSRRDLFKYTNTNQNAKDTRAPINSLKQLLLSSDNSYTARRTNHFHTNHTEGAEHSQKSSSTVNSEKDARLYRSDQLHTSHPVYRTISLLNGNINRMDLNEMKTRCKELQLDCNGKREAVKRRLKEYYKTEKLIQAGLLERRSSDERNSDYFIVIDFEATCEEKNPPGYPHEIIEFPAVLVSAKEKSIIDVFHSFVRPTINPILSEFCHNLTGISQATVDNADTFEIVHERFLGWMAKHELTTRYTYTMVTDGPFDMGRFLYLQTRHLAMPFPYSYAGTWANLRKCFANFYKGDFYGGSSANNNPSNRLPGLQTMLDMLGLEFEGTPHSGVDDARNIARILVRLLSDRAFVRVNEKILINNTSKADDDNRSAARLANVIPVTRREAEKWFRAQKKEVQTFVSSEQQDEHKIIDKSTLSNTPLL